MYKICFVAQNIYPLLKENNKYKFVGGAEIQQLLLGRGLAEKGNDVCYITMDHGQGEFEKIDDFSVISTFKPDDGIPVFRFLYPRLYKIWKALQKADADIYYVRCAGFILGICSLFSKIYKKKIVYNGASDSDFNVKHSRLPTKRDKIMFEWGLKKASLVIVQNQVQQNLLKQNYGIAGQKIHNGFHVLNHHDTEIRDTILWVGTDKTIKKPELFIELAGLFPKEKFVMIGGISASNDSLLEKAKALSNLNLTGFIAFNETDAYYKNARLLVNTSGCEGFPNAFLQAWRRDVPVISFADPDSLIQNNFLGMVAADMGDMIDKMEAFFKNKIIFPRGHIQTFFEKNLSLDIMTEKFDKAFSSLIRKHDN